MGSPMYRQIAEDLRAQIESGGLRPGQQLRTELELRDHYGASRNTVRDAIKWLITLGLVETKPGQGTFVVEKTVPFVTTLTGDPSGPGGGMEGPTLTGDPSGFGSGTVGSADRSGGSQRNKKASYSRVQVEIQKASGDVATGLWIEGDTEVISRHERRYIDDDAWSMQTSYYPMEFADRGAERLRRADNIEQGTVQYLADTLHIRQVGYRDRITMRAPNATEADFFKLPPDGRVPMFEIFRTAFDGNGTPMRLTVTVYPAHRNQFVVDVGKVPESLFEQESRERELEH